MTKRTAEEARWWPIDRDRLVRLGWPQDNEKFKSHHTLVGRLPDGSLNVMTDFCNGVRQMEVWNLAQWVFEAEGQARWEPFNQPTTVWEVEHFDLPEEYNLVSNRLADGWEPLGGSSGQSLWMRRKVSQVQDQP